MRENIVIQVVVVVLAILAACNANTFAQCTGVVSVTSGGGGIGVFCDATPVSDGSGRWDIIVTVAVPVGSTGTATVNPLQQGYA